MNIDELFLERTARADIHADMIPHMQQLRDLARECDHCTEFGVRTGNSTVALLAGLKDRGAGILCGYDLNPPERTFPEIANVEHKFKQADTGKLAHINPTDLLLIDTMHNAAQVRRELKHEPSVRKYIVFHDVVAWGWRPENGEQGILPAVFEFLAEHWLHWRVYQFHASEWGLLVLRRNGS